MDQTKTIDYRSSEYDNLPDPVKRMYSAKEYAWLPDGLKKNIVSRNCTPDRDMFDDED